MSLKNVVKVTVYITDAKLLPAVRTPLRAPPSE